MSLRLRRRAHITVDIDQTSSLSSTTQDTEKATSEEKEEAPSDKKKMKIVSPLSLLPARIAKHVENIRTMRQARDAPVDTMGCDKLQDEKADDKTKRYQILLSLMLSSQTKDQVTHDAMVRLKSQVGGCTMKKVAEIAEENLADLLRPVGMYRRKASYIKKATEILIEKYDSDIPRTFDELCALPGVGPKMSLLALEAGWGITHGIAVDTHVHRISNWLEWVDKPTKDPEQTRSKLEKLFPKEMWPEINHLLVGFGQTICKPVKPACDCCLNRETCSVGKKFVPSPKKISSSPKEKSEKISPYFGDDDDDD